MAPCAVVIEPSSVSCVGVYDCPLQVNGDGGMVGQCFPVGGNERAVFLPSHGIQTDGLRAAVEDAIELVTFAVYDLAAVQKPSALEEPSQDGSVSWVVLVEVGVSSN